VVQVDVGIVARNARSGGEVVQVVREVQQQRSS
jgi:hypothetical protein